MYWTIVSGDTSGVTGSGCVVMLTSAVAYGMTWTLAAPPPPYVETLAIVYGSYVDTLATPGC